MAAPALPTARAAQDDVARAAQDDVARAAHGGPHAAGASPSLSPSRAADFLSCPLKYRFRVVDRLPEPPSEAATRGTVVHTVLERLFDLPPQQRTPEAAKALVQPAWEQLLVDEPDVAGLFEADEDGSSLAGWLASAGDLVDAYFSLEDPRRLAPQGREERVEVELGSGLRLRGIVDRLDVAPDGRVRVVDYKTGRAPGEAYEARALFQMKFYALVLWRSTGRIPTVLQLMYLGDREVLRYAPDEADLRATERKLEALWAAVSRALETGDFRPRRSALCSWCSHQALCPEFGGTPPPLPPTASQPAVHGADAGKSLAVHGSG